MINKMIMFIVWAVVAQIFGIAVASCILAVFALIGLNSEKAMLLALENSIDRQWYEKIFGWSIFVYIAICTYPFRFAFIVLIITKLLVMYRIRQLRKLLD